MKDVDDAAMLAKGDAEEIHRVLALAGRDEVGVMCACAVAIGLSLRDARALPLRSALMEGVGAALQVSVDAVCGRGALALSAALAQANGDMPEVARVLVELVDKYVRSAPPSLRVEVALQVMEGCISVAERVGACVAHRVNTELPS